MISMDFEMELSSGGFSLNIKAFKTLPQHSRPDQSLVGENNDDIDACDKDDHLVVQDFEGDFEVLAQVSILHVWRQCRADQP